MLRPLFFRRRELRGVLARLAWTAESAKGGQVRRVGCSVFHARRRVVREVSVDDMEAARPWLA